MEAIYGYLALIVIATACIFVARNKKWRSTKEMFASADKSGIVIIDHFDHLARRRAHHDIG